MTLFTSPQKDFCLSYFNLLNSLALSFGDGEELQPLTVRMIAARLRLGTLPGLDPGDCWPWSGLRNNRGYGQIYFTDRGVRYSMTASRAILALQRKLPFRGRDLVSRHGCDHPWCVNPEHLEPGTQKQNAKDSWERKRHPEQHGIKRRQSVRRYKLSDDDVRSIRVDARSLREVSEAYGVSFAQISKIRNGKAKTLVSA